MVTEPDAPGATGTSGATRLARRRVQKSGRTEVAVAATPDQVMAVVADVTRVGEWSHECQGAAWLGGATKAAPGVQFRGRNRSGLVRWGRRCEIVTAGPRELVWRTVPTPLYPDSVEWAIRVRETEGGTTIEQTYRVLRIPALHDWVYGTVIPAHRDRSDALVEDLRRLGELAARADARRP
jgi:hypothetical protein